MLFLFMGERRELNPRMVDSQSTALIHFPLLVVKVTTSGMASSHSVTGSVYKAREQIHRRMANRRLLAIPASCR